MSDKLWKAVERQVARYFNGRRNPVHGSGPSADVSTPILSIEVKEREDYPQWLEDAVIEAVSHCEPNKMPVVVLHKKGRNLDNDWLIVRLKDYKDWHIGEGQGGRHE